MDDSCVSPTTSVSALSQAAYLLFYCRLPGKASGSTPRSPRPRPGSLPCPAAANGGPSPRPAIGPSPCPDPSNGSSSGTKRPLIGPELPPPEANGLDTAQHDSNGNTSQNHLSVGSAHGSPCGGGRPKVTRIGPTPRAVSRSPAIENGKPRSVWELGGKRFDPTAYSAANGCSSPHQELSRQRGASDGRTASHTSVWENSGIKRRSAAGAAALIAQAVAGREASSVSNAVEYGSRSSSKPAPPRPLAAAKGPPEQRQLREKLRAWCQQGPMAAELASAHTLRGPELQKLKREVEGAIRESPETVLGQDRFREALLEMEALLETP